ncbi:hypothetical protein D6792_00740 [Candidatus Parcubacteria bacterium]|nr:MAG: hypothetical protein D6792_00740 [Candidatus Parcubacteria bacterium]
MNHGGNTKQVLVLGAATARADRTKPAALLPLLMSCFLGFQGTKPKGTKKPPLGRHHRSAVCAGAAYPPC